MVLVTVSKTPPGYMDVVTHLRDGGRDSDVSSVISS